ncbi:MAG: hypothetical protein ACJAX5_001451 [Patiriisocius sp.]
MNKLFLLCLLLPFSAFAEDTLISTTETLAFGVFTSYGKKSVTGSATDDAPPLNTVKTYRFRDFTNRIPMQIGTEFGIEYQINTKAKGQPINISTVIIFPDPGLKPPGGKTYKKSRETNRVSIGKGHLHGYGFDEKWEMVPGEWTFEVWHKKARLVKRSFTVFDPEKETLEPSE